MIREQKKSSLCWNLGPRSKWHEINSDSHYFQIPFQEKFEKTHSTYLINIMFNVRTSKKLGFVLFKAAS